MTTNEMTTREESTIMTNGNGKALMAGGLLVAGGLVGALLGILYAPKRGKETREEILHSAEGLVKKAKEQYAEACQRIDTLASRKKELVIAKTAKLKKAVDAGVGAYKQ